MVDSRDQENRIIESLKLQRLVRQVTAFSCKKKKKKKNSSCTIVMYLLIPDPDAPKLTVYMDFDNSGMNSVLTNYIGASVYPHPYQ